MTEEFRCTSCNALLSSLEAYLGKVLIGGTATALGISKTKSLPATLLLSALGTAVGHALDEWRIRTGRIVCGQCGHVHQPA